MEQDIDHNHLGNLFKKQIQNYQPEVTEEEWNTLELKLKKVNFLRFSLINFNIYYTLMLLSCFIFSGATFVDYFLLRREPLQITTKSGPSSIQPKSEIEDKSLLETEGNFINQPNRTKRNFPENTAIVYDSLTNNLTNDSTRKNDFLHNDNKPIAEKNVSVNSSSYDNNKADSLTIPKVKPKKTLYITRQDTIIVYDTLSNKKRRAKKIK
jgi:hypothetical protein